MPAALLSLVALAALSAPLRAQQVECDRDGSPPEVRSLSFVGNRTFSDDQLSTFVVTTPSSFTRRHFRIFGAKRCYPVDGLAPDVAALKTLYRNNGFYDTKVDTVVKRLSKTAVAITFRVAEGRPLILDSLTIAGLDSLPKKAAILRDLPLKVGGRFGIVLLATERDSIVARLANSGYPRADVFQSYDADSINHHASVELQAVTGPRAHFGTIAVTSANAAASGPGEIDSAVVLRLLGFRTGQPYSDLALTDAQRNLYNLGAYRHVTLEVDTTWQHGDSVADVSVDLREDYLRQYDQTEGWGTLDCFRVTSQFTDKNFLDNAQHLELTGRLSKLGYGRPVETSQTRNLCYRPTLDRDSIGSSTLNYYAGATLTEPTLFGYHWVPSYSLYSERRGEYLAYLRATDVGFSASATRQISFATPLRLGYSLELGHTRAEPAVLCFVFGRCEPVLQEQVQQRQRLGVLSALLQQTRIDNVVAPTQGYNAAFEIRGSAPKVTGSDTALKFLKGTGDISWYAPLRRHLTFLFRVRGGYIVGGTSSIGLGDSTTHGARLPPPQERLFAGGADNVRGFGQNQLGPLVYTLDRSAFTVDSLGPDKDTLVYVAKPGASSRRPIPVGGNALLVLNAELRVRDPFIPDLLEYVPFLDAGQVWTRGSATDLDYKRLEITPGLGIRYFSPVGPIKISAGYNPYASRPGPAYFPSPVDPRTLKAPLICVTAPGTAPLKVVVQKNGELVQDAAACPATFRPFVGSGFFSHLTWNFSIGTDF
ncbi:MAG TPA: BamA/TamA family outer membrane protein [Gemmatimonadaceae bacterium]|nr:BamA/TamA family outer membrane protein [Gemmatimonadaceae bacterium]